MEIEANLNGRYRPISANVAHLSLEILRTVLRIFSLHLDLTRDRNVQKPLSTPEKLKYN